MVNYFAGRNREAFNHKDTKDHEGF
jgi:hypothetical protein